MTQQLQEGPGCTADSPCNLEGLQPLYYSVSFPVKWEDHWQRSAWALLQLSLSRDL